MNWLQLCTLKYKTRSSFRFSCINVVKARVSGSEFGADPQYVSEHGLIEDPTPHQLQSKFLFKSTPRQYGGVVEFERFFLHSLSVDRVYSKPSGLKTGNTYQSKSFVHSWISVSSLLRSSFTRQVVTAFVIHSLACASARVKVINNWDTCFRIMHKILTRFYKDYRFSSRVFCNFDNVQVPFFKRRADIYDICDGRMA